MRSTAGDNRVNAKHKRPDCGITGWAAAWTQLERTSDDDQRNLLADLVRSGGFHGAPAMAHLAGLLRYYAGLSDYPLPPKALKVPEVQLIERRARDLLAPYMGHEAFPKMRKLAELGEGVGRAA